MRTRFTVLTTVAVVLLSLVTANFSFGGDKDPPAVATAATATTTSPTAAPVVKWQARPSIGASIFYSKKADTGPLATPHSRQRLKHALIGMRLAKKPVEEGGLGLCVEITGALSVEENWDRFVNRLMLPPTITGESE